MDSSDSDCFPLERERGDGAMRWRERTEENNLKKKKKRIGDALDGQEEYMGLNGENVKRMKKHKRRKERGSDTMSEEVSEVTGEEMPRKKNKTKEKLVGISDKMSQHEIPAEASQKKTDSNKQGEGEINGWTMEVPIQGAPADETPRKRKKTKRKEPDTDELTAEPTNQEAPVEEMPTKKKKKKQKERETDEFTVEPTAQEAAVEEMPTKKKKKKKRKEWNTDESVMESSARDAPIEETPRKKKKKQKEMQPGSSSAEFLTPHAPIEETPRKKKKKQKETQTDVSSVEPTSQEPPIEKTPRKRKKDRLHGSTKEPIIQETTSEETATEKDANSSTVEATIQEGQRVKTSQPKNKEREREVRGTSDESEILSEQPRDFNGEDMSRATLLTKSLTPQGKRQKENEQQPQQNSDEKELNMMTELDELKEFVPNAEFKDSQQIRRLVAYDLPRYKEFKRKGIPLRSGRFSKQENERLVENVKDFMALTGIDNAVKLFYPSRFPEEKNSITKAKKDHGFFGQISEGIPRSCHDIYMRGRNLFDDRNYMGEFTEEEIRSLCKLHSLHGNDWKKLSDLTGRSPAALEKRFSQLKKKTGHWSDEEMQSLLHAVRDHFISKLDPEAQENPGTARISRTDLYSNLPWTHLAEKVKTRAWTQCREKWMLIVKAKMSPYAVKDLKQTRKWKIQLIKAMYQLNLEDIADVNWEDLTHTMGDVPPAYVQERFHKLKVRRVPHWQTKSFDEIIDFLHDKVLPVLEGEAAMDDASGGSASKNSSTQKDTFLFSDIFGHM